MRFRRTHHERTLFTSPIPAPGTFELRAWAESVGHELDRRGTKPLEPQLQELASCARQHRVAAVSSSVLADRRQSDVARATAFSRVVSTLIELAPAGPATDVGAA